MSAEIKHRAWDHRKGQMIEDLGFFKTTEHGAVQVLGRTYYGFPDDRRNVAASLEVYPQDTLTIMRWTGSKDANGINIFEGDVVGIQGLFASFNRGAIVMDNARWEVQDVESEAGYALNQIQNMPTVLGHIYEIEYPGGEAA